MFFQKTPLYLAVQNKNIEAIKLLLAQQNIDVNKRVDILHYFLIRFKKYINLIQFTNIHILI